MGRRAHQSLHPTQCVPIESMILIGRTPARNVPRSRDRTMVKRWRTGMLNAHAGFRRVNAAITRPSLSPPSLVMSAVTPAVDDREAP